MSVTLIGIIGIALLLVILFTNMPVGFVMGVIGFLGFAFIRDLGPACSLLAKDFFDIFASHGLTVVPLFVFMGQLSFIFRHQHPGSTNPPTSCWATARAAWPWATVGACAGFSAISGSTNATAATMATVTLPEMKKYGYDMGLATGTVAADGSLGILIPPSVVFIVYGILTEQSIGKLFAAGILPGLLLASLFMAVHLLPGAAQPGPGSPGPQDQLAFQDPLLFRHLGDPAHLRHGDGRASSGAYSPPPRPRPWAPSSPWCWPWPAGSSPGRPSRGPYRTPPASPAWSWSSWPGPPSSAASSPSTRIPFDLSAWIGQLPLPGFAIMLLIILIYLLGGCFMDSFAMIMLTIPIFFPVAEALGYDPIWFGVMIVLVAEMGVVTPPVGINVYVVHGVASDVPLETIFRGVLPMVFALVVCAVLILIFPQIALWLPNMMN